MVVNKVYYTENHIKGFVHEIIRGLASDGFKPDYIVGLTRGGLTPALMLSHYLKVPMHTLNVSLRDGDETGPESNLWMAEDAFGYSKAPLNILIVDDINDSGSTLNWIKSDWPSGCFPQGERWNEVWHNNVKFAVLIHNTASEFKDPDYIGHTINKLDVPEWCVFPWEEWWT